MDALRKVRREIEEYTDSHPRFRESLEPVTAEIDAPEVIKKMAEASYIYNVGPMAAVAGAVAAVVGESLRKHCGHLIIENGGDIYVKSSNPLTIAVYAGDKSPFTGKLRFRADPAGKEMGICTSSGRIGHSLSFGNADAVVCIAKSAEIADAAATSIANGIKIPSDIQPALERESGRGILDALLIVMDDRMGAWGDLELI